MREVVVERAIANADVGIALRRAASGVLLRRNTFDSVKTEIWDEAAVRATELARQRKLLESTSPLAVWRLANVQGTRVPDASGNGFDASLVGSAELIEGRDGPAARMGPQAIRVTIRHFNLQNVTLSAWICPSSIQGDTGSSASVRLPPLRLLSGTAA